ncbi:uncharacterized protein LOC111482641 isoform X1 [Cucurbita maxima]|uniref:Uncharacterized protein LOC111482641 isoform X1 n=1 Tax=Cucurbita maxima TaxID=3661 RepID=A0A6J1JA44_CUCMA|nr:uncharacterized protein LOC111482641 isoform X1 [Cucurbita maxima]
MEELRKLEQVQKLITSMESHGIAMTSSSSSNQFIANFVLLLVKPCGELDFEDKFNLVSEYMPKVSFSEEFLGEASLLLGDGGYRGKEMETTLQPYSDNKLDFGSSMNYCGEMAMVGLDAMQRANSSLEDFFRSYFMFHGMDVNNPQCVFKYFPILSFTESYIYQLDTLNEKIALGGSTFGESQEANERSTRILSAIKSDPFQPLINLHKSHGLLTERLIHELRTGEEYWALERHLCGALASKGKVSVEDVMRAIHLKSFDYRVLNLLLYQLRGEKVNDLHMEFLSISELLVEIADDLFDYEDDVLENNFNILRMFVRIYGASAPTALVKFVSEAEEKYDRLLKALDPHLSSLYQRRCEEATKEGGKVSAHPFGSWSMPPLIHDEESFRASVISNIQT